MEYYRLVTPDNGENILMKRASHREIHTTSTQPIDENNIHLPFEIDMHAGEESGYDQYDPDFEGEVEEVPVEERLLDYYRLPCVMTPELVDTLESAGADNLQAFPARVTNASTGKVLDREYLLVNILSEVNCADLANSAHDPLGSAHQFHDLKIDKQATGGLPLFRLGESPIEIIVNEDIAKAIKAGDFKGITVEAVG